MCRAWKEHDAADSSQCNSHTHTVTREWTVVNTRQLQHRKSMMSQTLVNATSILMLQRVNGQLSILILILHLHHAYQKSLLR